MTMKLRRDATSRQQDVSILIQSQSLFTLVAATLCGSRPDLVSHRSLVCLIVSVESLREGTLSLSSRHKQAQYNRDYPQDSTMVQCPLVSEQGTLSQPRRLVAQKSRPLAICSSLKLTFPPDIHTINISQIKLKSVHFKRAIQYSKVKIR